MHCIRLSLLAKSSLAICGALLSVAVSAGTISVYTSLNEDEIKDYLEQAKKDLPDIKINVLRLSTGDLGARILAESSNPRHDVVWGQAATNMSDKRIVKLLESYRPKGSEKLADMYRDADDKWAAATGYMAAFCVNTAVLEENKLPFPKTWADLAKPEFKGHVVMPSPVASGTGYMQVSTLLQKLGDEQGWEFIKSLDKNIAQYTKSGARPCLAAQTGEYAVGASLAISAIKAVNSGAPVKMVIPADGAGYELEASALMASSKNKEDAKKFLDWTFSPNAVKLYVQQKEIITIPNSPQSEAAQKAGLPADATKVVYPVDFVKSTEQREAIMKQWDQVIGR